MTPPPPHLLASHPAATPDAQREPWRPLVLLNLYRLALAAGLLVMHVSRLGPDLLGQYDPSLYRLAAWLYLGGALLGIALAALRQPGFRNQVHQLVAVDVLALTLLMHASGGVTSGLGILLIVSITSGSLIPSEHRVTFVYAAIATLAVLGETIYAHLEGLFGQTAYTQAGLLGTAFFATAVLDYTLARRAHHSQTLAEQRGIDLANLAELNEHIIQRLQSGILVIDGDQRVRLMNQTAWQLLGMPISARQPPLAEIAPELARQLDEWLANPLAPIRPFRPTDGPGDVQPRFARLSRNAPDLLIHLEDPEVANQQAQQQQLAALGRMSASIAHEIRNPLGAMSHAAQLLAESAEPGKPEQRLSRIIEENAQRVNSIIENVLQISRRQTSQPVAITIEPWLREFADEFSAGTGIARDQLAVEVQPGGIEVLMDPSQLHQVVWNLAKNAVEHGVNDQGRVQIALRAALDRAGLHPFLDVIDHGPGIDPETARQIFEPFYTTRTRGTGLGLFLARQLCELNEASLEYIAQPRGGSCFRIRFPQPQATR